MCSVSWYGARHTQCIILFLLFVLKFATKIVLSVGIVAMTDSSSNPNKDIPTYSWTNKSVILSSVAWGYLIIQLLSPKLIQVCGPKILLIIAMVLNSIFCCLIPAMATFGSWGVITCRVIQGLALGVISPSCHTLLGKWAPVEERAQMTTFIHAGSALGTVAALTVTGLISGSSLGWPYAFYLFGGLCLVWDVAYFFIGVNSPAEHPTIYLSERLYIETSLQYDGNKKAPPTPWKQIFNSVHVWAIIVTQSGLNWGYWTLLSNIPRYFNGVLHLSIKKNGLLSAGPYLTAWISSLVFSKISDTLIKNKAISIGGVRKIFNSISSFIPAIILLAIGLVDTFYSVPRETILVLFFIAIAADAASYSSFVVNHLDLSPNHAGTLMSIATAFSSTCSLFAPLILQWIVTDEANPLQWANVFYISSGFYFFGNVFFLIFSSGEVQPWNFHEE